MHGNPGSLRIGQDGDRATGDVHLWTDHRRSRLRRGCYRLGDVLYVDVAEPEGMHARHLGRRGEHAAKHLRAPAEHVVHLAVAHVHFTGPVHPKSAL